MAFEDVVEAAEHLVIAVAVAVEEAGDMIIVVGVTKPWQTGKA